ncbi:Aste57867_17481 [Aphanomyces stellatus]|uniref:Aste57867_17481 protein n=1 Tax=Aphanomyces stellatus TaxID=120398 RepID=A0A485L955_9STRA|nr:hypothetical protein As57867_017421 [Aphanomyces stellatus]VFT94234.1 Aste57867_17481 [Aphanomyces stellatus]
MTSSIPTTMRAVGLHAHLPIEYPSSLVDLQVDVPAITGRDLLVQVKAISVNPVDYKLRAHGEPLTSPKILGYDAAGVVVAVGPDASLFKVGDEVFYAGTWTRQGTNAEYHAVDERIVGRKPASLSFTDAAALPLTSLTAYEALFHRLGVPQTDNTTSSSTKKKSVLILNGSGGVGSIAIQLAKHLTDLTVIATASRPQSTAWVRELGADHVVNHTQDIPSQLKALGHAEVDYVLVFSDLPPHFDAIAEVIKPQGKICGITSFTEPLPFSKFFLKSVTFVFELMFTRAVFATDDIEEQHRILNHVSALVDAKHLRTTVGQEIGAINAANLKTAHAALEAGRTVGKLVLTGF